ncbi:hypothetical protein ABZ756_07070 [Mammaliicoccus sciuri]
MKTVIYENDSSKLEIEFDGDYYLITQTVFGVDTQQISVTDEEIGFMFKHSHNELD